MILKCQITGHPEPYITMMKSGTVIPFQFKYSMIGQKVKRYVYETRVENFNFQLGKGIYECQASNSFGRNISRVEIVAKSPPKPKIIVKMNFIILAIENVSDSENILHANDRKRLLPPIIEFLFSIEEVKITKNGMSAKLIAENKRSILINGALKGIYDQQANGIYFYYKFSQEDLNLKRNSVYNLKANVRNYFGWSGFSDKYTYVSTHVCGNNVSLLRNEVEFFSPKEFNVLVRNYKCNSPVYTNPGHKICIKMKFVDCKRKSILIHDGDNTNANIVERNCTHPESKVCSSSENLYFKFDQPGTGFGFKMNLVAEIKNKKLNKL
ncbi:hypothetical protein B4U79_16225 [Dinothrombium tinctorium]|uniref:Ig-like domain-containing protein n=1 Tax=Dinothrombium tinctorium TaxID=1965070 RepID=A0A3S3RXV2_9ACAR|nr:hypothetical protein B4U79_16225 [Dinothrombium tinctorium]